MKYIYSFFIFFSFGFAGIVGASCAGLLEGCEEEFYPLDEYTPTSGDIELLRKMDVLIDDLDRTQSMRIKNILENAEPKFASDSRQHRFIENLLAHKNISYLYNRALYGDFFDGINLINDYYTHLSRGNISEAYDMRISGVGYEEYYSWYGDLDSVSRKIMKRNTAGDYELNVGLRDSSQSMSDDYRVILRIVDNKIETISSTELGTNPEYQNIRDEVQRYTGLNPGILDVYGKTDDNRYYYACMSSGLTQSQIRVYDILLEKIKYEELEEVTGRGIDTCFPYSAEMSGLKYLIDGESHFLTLNAVGY